MTQLQIAILYDKSKSTINEHINNILSTELNENEVVRKFGKIEFSNLLSKQLDYKLDSNFIPVLMNII